MVSVANRGSAVMKFRWEADPELSAARASYVLATGMVCNDRKTEQLLSGAVNEINQRLASASIDIRRFWTSYIDRMVAGDVRETAVSLALLRAGDSELQVEQTSRAINSRLSDARHLFFSAFSEVG